MFPWWKTKKLFLLWLQILLLDMTRVIFLHLFLVSTDIIIGNCRWFFSWVLGWAIKINALKDILDRFPIEHLGALFQLILVLSGLFDLWHLYVSDRATVIMICDSLRFIRIPGNWIYSSRGSASVLQPCTQIQKLRLHSKCIFWWFLSYPYKIFLLLKKTKNVDRFRRQLKVTIWIVITILLSF